MDAGGSCHSCNYRLQTGQKNGIKEREDWTMNRDIFMELMVKREYKAVRSILDDEHRGHCVPAGGA